VEPISIPFFFFFSCSSLKIHMMSGNCVTLGRPCHFQISFYIKELKHVILTSFKIQKGGLYIYILVIIIFL
jgi:hypothetical protein